MAKYTITNIYISMVLFFLFALAAPIAAADVSHIDSLLRVSPVLLKIKLEPGSKQLQTITIENLTNAPMPIRANTEGFDPSDEQSGFSPSTGSSISPLSQWITIEESEAIIPAKTKKEFIIKISVPGTVPVGGYYAIIFFSPLYPGSSVTSKIGVIALANIGVQDTLKNNVHIREFAFDTPLYEKNPLTARISVTNTALNYFSAKPTITISPLWGASDSVSLDEKIILPAKSRTWKSVFSIQNSKWGIYFATLTISIGNGVSVSKTIPVALLPIRLILVVVALALLIYFFWKKRMNALKAVQILFSPTSSDSTTETPNEKVNTSTLLKEREDIDPQVIIDTVKRHHGSISEAAKTLHLHRSTVHRWMKRAHVSVTSALLRKSTRPHSKRTSILSQEVQQRIIQMKNKEHCTTEKIIQKLHLTVSPRTVHRVLKSHNMTRHYLHKDTIGIGK